MSTSQIIINQKRYLLRETQPDLGRQTRRFAEVDQVFQRECERDRFREVDGYVLFGLVDVGVLSEGHRSAADVSLARELDAFFGGFDNDCGWTLVGGCKRLYR